MTDTALLGCYGLRPAQPSSARKKTLGGSDLLRRSDGKWVRFKSALTTGAQCGNTGFDKPGQIQRFRSYAKQSSASHDEADTPDALSLHSMQISPSAVDVSRAFLTMWNEKRSWAEAGAFFDCVFEPRDRLVEADEGPYVHGPRVRTSVDFSPQ